MTRSALVSSEGGNDDAEADGGLEVDEQLDLGDPLHRQLRRLLALQDAAGMAPGLPVRLAEIAAIAHQPAGEREVARLGDRRHLVADGERGELLAAVGEVGIGAEDQSAGAARPVWR